MHKAGVLVHSLDFWAWLHLTKCCCNKITLLLRKMSTTRECSPAPTNLSVNYSVWPWSYLPIVRHLFQHDLEIQLFLANNFPITVPYALPGFPISFSFSICSNLDYWVKKKVFLYIMLFLLAFSLLGQHETKDIRRGEMLLCYNICCNSNTVQESQFGSGCGQQLQSEPSYYSGFPGNLGWP